jgi:DNA polymerase-1
MKSLIIDSSYLIYRSYFAYPNLTANLKPADLENFIPDFPQSFQEIIDEKAPQFPIGSMFGFAKTVLYLIKDLQPDSLIFTFDLKEKTWRHKLKKDYKEGRAPAEMDMIAQIPLIKNWTNKITKNNFFKEGFEADDCIFASSQDILKNNPGENEILIFSSDKDLYQVLVHPEVKFIKTNKFGQLSLFDDKKFIEKYNLKPCQWVDLKAIVGDPSDNLTGINGIGEKTASKILNIFGSLKNLFLSQNLNFEHLFSEKEYNPQMLIEFQKENSRYQNFLLEIVKQKELVLENYKLATLSPVESCQPVAGFDLQKGLVDFEKLNFISLVNFYKKHLDKKDQQEAQESLF